MAVHDLPLERRSLHGHFSCDLDPVLTVERGDSVRIAVPNAGWRLDSGEHFQPRQEGLDDGHALAGPIEVRGARAGQALAVRIDEVRAGRRGVTFSELPHWLDWELDGDVGRTAGRTVRLAPFLGVLGMPPPEPGVHPTAPPRPWGGNIDCKELVAGTTLFLPIPVDGALFSAGDGHAAQGDGEVAGTAIECPMERAELTFGLSDRALTTPLARGADGSWITFGLHEDIDEAAVIALNAMLELLGREHGLSRRDALALASLQVDLRITQLVNEVRGVHAVLRPWH
jgi:acetamidase/formamidase